MMPTKKEWLLTGGVGASLFGLGICTTIECAFLKYDGYEWFIWTGLGTFSLFVLILGIVLLIKAGLMETKLK